MRKKEEGIEDIGYRKMMKEKMKEFTIKRIAIIVIVVSILLTITIEFASATKYKTMINVVQNTTLIEISPIKTALDFGALAPTSAETRKITIENKGARSTYVVIHITGDIANWIKLNRNYFWLDGGKNETIDFRLFIPPTASYGVHEGTVYIFRLP